MTAKPNNPEVHPAEFDELNRRFYSRPGPDEYFDNRFTALVQHLGRERRTKKTEYTYGELSVTVGPGNSSSDDSQYAEERDRFAALDATVLLHHAAESLVRLYLGPPPAPRRRAA